VKALPASRFVFVVACVACFLLCSRPVRSQVAYQLSAYTGPNASGYLAPLLDAFAADVNSGLFHSAHIPRRSFRVGVEIQAMVVRFGEADRTFWATTEDDFNPQRTVRAPTIVGSGRAVIVSGNGATQFAFPGGFNMESVEMAVPQVRVGTIWGTEAVFRLLFFDTGPGELEDVNLYGFGARHSLSQYWPGHSPLDASMSFFWQRVTMGDNGNGGDLITGDALSVGLQASRRIDWLEPYAGISIDRIAMDVTYEASSSDRIDLSLDSNSFHAVFGLSLNMAFANIHAEYNLSNQNALSIGMALDHYFLK
jgi:hypothetical protein